MKNLIAICFLWIIAACRVGPDFKIPETVKVKNNYTEAVGKTDSLTNLKWFEVYKDEALNSLIKEALDSNRNLLMAIANVEEARASAAMIKADLLPKVGYNLGGKVSEFGSNAPGGFAGMNVANFNTGLALNWEIDLFGKIRNAKLDAANRFMASQETKKNVQVSLIAEVAANYFLLRDLDNRLIIANRALESRKELFRIVSERYNKGYIAEIDKLQAEQQLAIAEGMIPNISRQITAVENVLKLLCGRATGTINRGQTNYQQQFPPDIPVGLPSELLTRRPDIKAAEFNVTASYNRIGIAQANRFPSLSLTGALGFVSPQMSSLINSNSLYGMASGSLVGPLFEFNKNKNRVVVEKQRAQALTIQYEQIVLGAFVEVETALNQLKNLNQEYAAYQKQVTITERAYELSKLRYTTGYTSYLEVLIQESTLLQVQLQESATLQQRHAATVNLYKALGGGW